MRGRYLLGIIGLISLVGVSALQVACVGPSARSASLALQTQALSKAKNGDYSGAITDTTEALRLDPSNAGLYADRARFRYDLGDDAGALADLDQALQLDPNALYAYLYRGMSRYRMQDYRGSIEDLTQALDRNPTDSKLNNQLAAITYRMRALTYEALHDDPRATQDLQAAAALYLALGDTEHYQGAQERLSHHAPQAEDHS
jgi:tetratricopeptide (TPR) repeat protein